jgi:hypothetical protein
LLVQTAVVVMRPDGAAGQRKHAGEGGGTGAVVGVHGHSPRKVSRIAVSTVRSVRAASTLALSAAKGPGHSPARFNRFLARLPFQFAGRFHPCINEECANLKSMIGGIVLACARRPF